MPDRRATRPRWRAALALTAVAALGAAGTAPVAAQAAPEPVPIEAFCTGAPDESRFVDVDPSASWAADVRCLDHTGITAGVSPGRYAPAGPVTRQQMASFVARVVDTAATLADDGGLASLPAHDGTNRFADVPDTSPHVGAINRLAGAGIARGGPAGAPTDGFGPGQPVTRGQLATFLARALEHLTGEPPAAGDGDRFPDDDSSVHEDAIDALAGAGIVVGYADGTYRPVDPVPRGQMAAFLIRPLAALEAAGRIATPPAVPDVPLALASEAGVVVEGGGVAVRVTTTPSAAAYAVGPDLVVHQDGEWGLGRYPADPVGPVRVLDGAERRTLATAEGAAATLLDARLLGGTPTALVVERGGAGGDPEAVWNELVLVDLDDGDRTTVVRQDGWDAWEAGFIEGRVLADGDVVVIQSAEAFSWLARWTPGADEPAWTAELDQTRTTLVATDDAVHTVDVPHDRPALLVREHDPATGQPAAPVEVPTAWDGDDASSGPLCIDQLRPGMLACGVGDGAPRAVDTATGWSTRLPGTAGALPTVVRSARG